MRRIALALDGGDEIAARWLAARLDPDEAELVPAGAAADVVIVTGDERVSALDRCRQASRERPCVLLLVGPPMVEDVTAAMAAGARAVLSRDDDALAVGRAVAAAAAFVRASGSGGRPPASVVVVTGGHGGAGTSTLAVAVAASLPGRVALVDLDLAGGRLGDLLGVVLEPSDPGLAAHTSGATAWEELCIDAGWCWLVPAPHRPELAWLVGESVPAGLVAAAAAAAEAVVVDAGRAAGPALEVVNAADVILVACRPAILSIAAAARHQRILERLAPAASVRLCVTGAGRRDIARLRLGRVRGGAVIGQLLPEVADPSRPPRRIRVALAALARVA